MSTRMTGREMLLAHINTLSDIECTNIYFILNGITELPDYCYFDKDGELISYEQAQEQYHIKLTHSQYNVLINKWGEKKFKDCVRILSLHNEPKNLIFEYGVFKLLVGWVEREYKRLVRYRYIEQADGEKETVKPFTDVENKDEAQQWILSIPPEVRNKSPYVFYLRNKFNLGEL